MVTPGPSTATGTPEVDTDLDLRERSPRIGLDDVTEVLAALRPPRRPRRILSHSTRPTAAGVLVEVDRAEKDPPEVGERSRALFVKRFAPGTATPASLAPTHRLAAHLAARGLPTPTFLDVDRSHPGATSEPTVLEPTVLESGGWLYEVSTAAEGEDRYRTTPSWTPPHTMAEARHLGAVAAQIALAARDFAEPAAPVSVFRSAFDLLAQPDLLDPWLEERPGVRRYLDRTGRPLREDLQRQHDDFVAPVAALLPELGSSWVHGDLHVSNEFWRGEEVSSIIDLGLAGRVFPLYDLAVAIERNALRWPEILRGDDTAYRLDVATAIIEGYAAVRPLSDAERIALPALLPVVQSESALHWIEYQNGCCHDQAAADWSYQVFFQAHPEWFSSPAGRDLTRRLVQVLDRTC